VFTDIAAFEFRYQLRNPVFWIAGGLFFLLAFGSVTVDGIRIGDTANVHLNSPFAINERTLILSIMFMFVSTAFVANVVVRDDETGFGPILRATGVLKSDYLFGRYLGAFGAAALAFLAVPAAILVGSLMPWLDVDKVGPLRPWDYIEAYLYSLPTLFFTSAAFFALATATRSMMATYIGVVGLLIAYGLTAVLMSRLELHHAAALADPFGARAYGLATRYWTASDRNTLNPPIAGDLLANRLIWTAAGFGFLGLAWRVFRFEARPARARRAERLGRTGHAPAAQAPAADGVTRATPSFGAAAAVAQFWARTRFDIGQVVRSPAFFVLLVLGVFNSAVSLWLHEGVYDVALFPVTRVMIEQLRGAYSFVPMLVAIYYAGELVWRERDRRTEGMIDCAPIPDWAFLVPKIAAIALVLAAMFVLGVAVAAIIQTLQGFYTYEWGKYLAWFVVPETVNAILLAILAVFLQTLSPHKFVGWLLMLVVLVSQLTLGAIGWEHNLYIYGGTPPTPLSDMNGMGEAGVAAWWFRAYWAAIALVLGVLAYGLWRRGAGAALWPRLARLPHSLAGPAGAILAMGLVLAVAIGGYIFVNTNVWNTYHTSKDDDRWLADYEKTFLPFEALPQPTITDVKLNVRLDPAGAQALTSGAEVIVNRTTTPLTRMDVRFEREAQVRSLAIDGAHLERAWPKFNYRIFRFDRPMAPGEARTLTFVTWRGQRGFKNTANDSSRVMANGTFLDDMDIAPILGMDRRGLLKDRAKRRKYHLPQDLRPPSLEDDAARAHNALRMDSDWVNADITVSTSADQIPIAPGRTISDVVADGRRTTRFRTDAPIMNFFSIQSARYAMRRANYKGLALSVYFHPGNAWNVDRMIAAMEAGLDYDQANFSPYQFHQARILEFPDYSQFAQSFANTIPYSEGIGFIFDPGAGSKIDMVTYVTAHEIAHQWWGHQEVAAYMQGGTMLIETLAQYSAIMTMEHRYGRDQIRKFLKYELDNYLRARGSEAVEEVPLERVEDQGYIHYRKGSLVMYRLKDEIGEAAVNRALRALLQKTAFKGAPYPASKDLVALFRKEAPADKQQLITDLFEKITLYDLKAKAMSVQKRPDGRYDVTLRIEGQKFYADGRGRQAQAPLNETMDIGLFAAKPGEKAFTARDVILLEKTPVTSGPRTLRFVTARPPVWGGVDPYNTVIDRNSDDNVVKAG
jgi:ABC-type transport system involved in multi-copper enzyme maturation permease subunit